MKCAEKTETQPVAPGAGGAKPVAPDRPGLRAWNRGGICLLILILAVASQFLSSSHLALLTTVTIYAFAGMGLNLLTGNAGLISIAHAAFMGVGAFSAAFLTQNLGVPALISILLAGLIAAAAGLLFGLPSLRLKGVYLVMASFSAQIILYWFFEQARWLTGGEDGRFVERPVLFGINLEAGNRYYLLVLIFAVLGGLAYSNLLRTRMGRAFAAVRENPRAAEIMGVNLFQTKLTAFAVSTFYAGVAGALMAWYLEFVAIQAFTLFVSVQLLALVIIGGLGTLAGAILGAIFIVLVPEALDSFARAMDWEPGRMASIRQGVFGLLVVTFLLYEPRGMARSWRRFTTFAFLRADSALRRQRR